MKVTSKVVDNVLIGCLAGAVIDLTFTTGVLWVLFGAVNGAATYYTHIKKTKCSTSPPQ